MADDLGSILGDVGSIGAGIVQGLGAIAPTIGQLFMANQQQKQQNQLVKSLMQGPAGMGFARLGLGYGAQPIYGSQVNTAYGVPGGQIGPPTPSQAAVMGGYGDMNIGGPFSGPSGISGFFNQLMYGPQGVPPSSAVSRPRAPAVFMTTDPLGRQVAVRSLGRPLLWSGDLSAAKRVRRVVRKIGGFVHHRPR